MGESPYGSPADQKRRLVMAKFTLHTDPETRSRLKDELPEGKPWGEYLLESVELRKKIESRELVLTEPDTRSVEEKEE